MVKVGSNPANHVEVDPGIDKARTKSSSASFHKDEGSNAILGRNDHLSQQIHFTDPLVPPRHNAQVDKIGQSYRRPLTVLAGFLPVAAE